LQQPLIKTSFPAGNVQVLQKTQVEQKIKS